MKFSQKNSCYVVKDVDLGISRCTGSKVGRSFAGVTAPNIPLAYVLYTSLRMYVCTLGWPCPAEFNQRN